MRKTLSITVYNQSGVLTRISTVFSSRGFNIESIAVGPTENIGISKIIIVLPGDNQTIEQITKQLNKLIQVIEVKDITYRPCVERELMLVKVSLTSCTRSDILEIVDIFRSKVVDISEKTITIEVTGDPGKIVAIQQLLKPYSIKNNNRKRTWYKYRIFKKYLNWGWRELNPHDHLSQQILSLLCLPFHHTPIDIKTAPRLELGNEGFAIQSLTTWLCRLIIIL
jgi:acetolactate synthase I/III small subunit